MSGDFNNDVNNDFSIEEGVPVPYPTALTNGIALGGIEYTFESFILGDTPVETMFLGATNITQQYATDENGAYLYDENEAYITYGD